MARIIDFLSLAALSGRFFAFSYLYDRVLRRIWAITTYKRILRNFSLSDRQSSERSPKKKSRLEVNETFTINQSTVPLGQTLSFPPTAGDIVAYEAATLAHRARTRRKCSICHNDKLHCFCEAIYGSESDTEHVPTTNYSLVEAAGMTNHDHGNHGFRPPRPLADGDDTIGEQDHITEARALTDTDIAAYETEVPVGLSLNARAGTRDMSISTMKDATRYLIEDAMLYSSSSSSSTSDDDTTVDDDGVPNDTVEAGQLIGAIDDAAVAAVEATAAEERHMDAGGATASAESYEAIVGATAEALANGSRPRFVDGPSPTATRLLKGLGVTPTKIASYSHSQLPTLSVTVNVGDDANNNDIEIDLSPSLRSRQRNNANDEMERAIELSTSAEALTSSSIMTASSAEVLTTAQTVSDAIGMAGARDLAFVAVADALASRQLDRVQPVAAEPHHQHQHQGCVEDSYAYAYADDETDRDPAQNDSVFEHSVFEEDTRTFEFEDGEEEDWVDATPSSTASSDVERHKEIRRQAIELDPATTSTDHSVR